MKVTKKQALISLVLNFILIIVIIFQLYQIYEAMYITVTNDNIDTDKLDTLSFCINFSILAFILQLISWFFKKYNIMVVAGALSIVLYFFKMIIFYFL